MWIVDAHGYGKRFIVRADEILTAFLELQRAIHAFAVSLVSNDRAETCVRLKRRPVSGIGRRFAK
jgi:hypothetical protein